MKHQGHGSVSHRLARRLPLALVALAALALGVFALTAVNGSSAPASSSQAPKTDPDGKSFKAFRECLRENGVKPRSKRSRRSRRAGRRRPSRRGSRRSGPSRGDRQRFERAVEKCAGNLPDDARERFEQRKKFRECMKENGVELKPRRQGRRGGGARPGRNRSGRRGGRRGDRGPSGRRNRSGRSRADREKFEQALEKCEQFKPERI